MIYVLVYRALWYNITKVSSMNNSIINNIITVVMKTIVPDCVLII